MNTTQKFRLDQKVVIITGGAGLLGTKHAEAVAEMGGIPLLLDISEQVISSAEKISRLYNVSAKGFICDITQLEEIKKVKEKVIQEFGKVDALINNAANNPKVGPGGLTVKDIRFENFPINVWEDDMAVGVTAAYLCSQVFAPAMIKNGQGVILNIASDLGVIAPDQRIYRKEGVAEDEQPVKPVTYSVVKHALIGLTKYLATYYADQNIRVNSISPAGVYTNQPDDFVKKLANLVPMKRMAKADEYQAAIVFLISDASSYMTGSNLIIDGGRTCW